MGTVILQTHTDHIKQLGGDHGRRIRLISCEDHYGPAHSVANTQKLFNEDRVFVRTSYFAEGTEVERHLVEDLGITRIAACISMTN